MCLRLFRCVSLLGPGWVVVPAFLFTSFVVLVRSWTATKESDGPVVGARVSAGAQVKLK